MEQEQNPTSNPSGLTNDIKAPKLGKNKYLWLILVLLLAGLAVGYWFNLKQSVKDSDLDLSPSEVDQLEGPQREQVLLKQLQDLESQRDNLTTESSRSDRFTVYIQLGEVYTALGRHDEAIKALDVIKDERVGNTRLWMTYAQVYKNMGNLPEARANVRKALDIDSELADNWLYMFGIISDLDRATQESIYKEALQRSGNLPEIQAAYDTWKTSQQ